MDEWKHSVSNPGRTAAVRGEGSKLNSMGSFTERPSAAPRGYSMTVSSVVPPLGNTDDYHLTTCPVTPRSMSPINEAFFGGVSFHPH